MKRIEDNEVSAVAAIEEFNAQVVNRGAEEVELSRDNTYMVHDWDRVRESPLFKHGFTQVGDIRSSL
jgi:hypothetical protein